MSLKSIKREPINGTGGLKYVLLADFNAVDVDMSTVLTDGLASITLADGSPIVAPDPDGTPVVVGNNPFVKIEMNKQSGNVANVYTGDAANGSGENAEVVTMVFGNAKKNAERTVAIQSMLNIYTVAIAVDKNDQTLVLGATDGCDATGDNNGTGQAGTDLNGHSVTLSAMEPLLSPSISPEQLAILSVPLP